MCFTFTDSLIVERLNSPLPFENFTIEPNSKKAFLYYFISFFLYLSPLFFLCFNFQELHLWTASTQISSFYDTKYKKLFAIPSLPKSIIFYNFVQKYHLVSKIEAYLSTQITKKNLFSSIHSQKCIYLPTILPLLFILARKIRGGEEKRRRKLRESSRSLAAIHCLTTNDDGTNSFPSSRSFQPTSNRSPKWALSPTWSR